MVENFWLVFRDEWVSKLCWVYWHGDVAYFVVYYASDVLDVVVGWVGWIKVRRDAVEQLNVFGVEVV